MDYSRILKEYLEIGIVSRMIEHGYALYPAKSAGYGGRRGENYHIDMSIRTHILNGIFPLTRLLTYLDGKGIYTMSEDSFRRLLVYFTTHDFHKDPDAIAAKGERGEFDVPLLEVEQEMDELDIASFVHTTAAEHRVTMIHKSSGKVGDYAEARTDTSNLEVWVHIADALSSIQSAREYHSIDHYLRQKLTRELARHPLKFYWHELDDYRGLSTLLIHQSISTVLEEKFGLFPLLYFSNGTLYLGTEVNDLNFDEVREQSAKMFFQSITDSFVDKALSIAQGAIRLAQSVKFEKYAFLFADVPSLVRAVQDLTRRYQVKQFLTQRFGKRLTSEGQRKGKKITAQAIEQFVKQFSTTYDIPADAQTNDDFSIKWSATAHFFMGLENLGWGLIGRDDTLEWMLKTLETPNHVRVLFAREQREEKKPTKTKPVEKKSSSGGTADHCIVLAYHYLVTHTFGSENRSCQTVEVDEILATLSDRAVEWLVPFNSVERRIEYVNSELGLQENVTEYLKANLTFSSDQARSVESPLAEYAKARSYSHKRLCVLCNREIPKAMQDHDIKTDVAEMSAQIFSDRVLPSPKVKGQMRWCPMCYLEFTLRRLSGMGFANVADPNSSERLYLFLLPDYSFTPEFWDYAYKVLKPFVSVTKMSVRREFSDPVAAPTIPNLWLLHHRVDSEWLDQVETLFTRVANQLALADEKRTTPLRDLPGEKMKVAALRSPNYQLLVFENSVSARNKKKAPTRSEMWAKATYAATLLQLLLGVRVYVTDKPYLPLTRPDEMKHIIQLDGVHALVRNVLPENKTGAPRGTVIPLVQLEDTIDLLSAVWEVNAALSKGNSKSNLDKQIAGILERVTTEPLAGASFYKERERDERIVYPALLAACQVLLKLRGGEKLTLAEKLTNASLDLYLPLGKKAGKAHRYETMFRTAIEMIKTNVSSSDAELEQKITGNLLKRLGRIDGGAVPAYGEDLRQRAEHMAHLVVNDLYRGRCAGRTAKLTHEENSLADAIYFLTDRQIGERWKKYKADNAARKEQKNASQ